jgi:MFS family permease
VSESKRTKPGLGARLPRVSRLLGLLDNSLARLSTTRLTTGEVRRLRWFWLDGLFSTISISFYTSFVPLFALAYGANNAQIGQLTAIASLCGLIALFPGAQAIKLMGGRRKALVVLFGGVIGRVPLLAWLVLPFVIQDHGSAVIVIIAVNALITFCAYFANPAWTAIVADIVPREIRGRFFSHRNWAVNLPALLVVPLAGLLIQVGNRPGQPFAGYEMAFALALGAGALATYSYARLDDPLPTGQVSHALPMAEWVRIIWAAPEFVSLVVCTLIWNLGVQMVGPFLNVYLVNNLGASTAMVGWVAAASSLMALLTQQWLGRWVDRRGNIWVQGALSFIIPWIPIAWMVARAAWQVVIINGIAGILWTGYSLASFNLLLDLAPVEARAEANALFQVVIVGSAAIAPIVGGHLADAFGYQPMFIVSAGLRLLGAAAFVWWVALPATRRARQLGSADH